MAFNHAASGDGNIACEWEVPEVLANESDDTLDTWNEINTSTKLLVENEINEFRGRINTILEEQRKNSEYFMGLDQQQSSTVTQSFQDPVMKVEFYDPLQPYSTRQFSDAASQPYNQEQIDDQLSSQEQFNQHSSQSHSSEVVRDQYVPYRDHVENGSDSTYFQCEVDNESDQSMNSTNLDQDAIENTKNLHVMRILTSIMKIRNVLNKKSLNN